MGFYSDQLAQEVRLERMRPGQVEHARLACPAIYVPFGSLEWHGIHNPIGLDAIKAHEQLVGLAVRCGGVVYPPVFFGAGGGHLDWPHTFMVSAEPMARLVTQLLWGFERAGYQKTILLSGHYPNRSEYLDAAIREYTDGGGKMAVLALVETQAPGGQGDHAALVETSFMLHLHSQTVDMSLLEDTPGSTSVGMNSPVDPQQFEDPKPVDFMQDVYRGHPCYGLVGVDPRGKANAAFGLRLTDNLIDFLAAWLSQADPEA